MSDWQHVQTLFLEAVELEPGERAEFLHRRCGDEVCLAEEVKALLAADDDSGMVIEAAVQDEAGRLFDAQMLSGERLGLYRIVREIGRGGMGSVFLAVRDDAEYSKQVAIKVVRRGMDTADVLERFRYERQILANLEHPYIARLFDGGSTEEGVPFFVMEYIVGETVEVFCRERALGPDAVCNLFLKILEAVAYAHRNLVVHRDLKPANILVMADGSPRLLDFGVAKLLTGDINVNQTFALGARPFTPGYASPEQVLGVPITTSSDIYSLGAVLYELLGGGRAQPIAASTPAEIERVVCHTDPPRLGVPGLSSDLDNIVRMAMRKEPERRYQSADQFAEDICRYLAGLPVIARQDSVPYRAGKFVLRHRIGVAAAGVVAASLLLGLGVALRQGHVARKARESADSQRAIAVHQTSLAEAAQRNEARQREDAEQQRSIAQQQSRFADLQRDRAEHEKTLADQRVTEMLALANRTLFDVHDTIAKLPGSVAARRTLVKTTLDYLQTLEANAGLDDAMRATLCAAYYKVAMIQGDAQGASLGDATGAGTSLMKAQDILLPAYKRHPEDREMMQRYFEVRTALADQWYRAGRADRAVATFVELLPVAHRLSQSADCDMKCRTQEGALYNDLTYDLASTDPARALDYANRGIAFERNILRSYPNDPLLKNDLGSLMSGAAGAYAALGELQSSADDFLQSIEAREELLETDPNDVALRRNLLIAYGNYAMVLSVEWSPNLGRYDTARIYAGKGVKLARSMVAADPNDTNARYDLGMILSRLGTIVPAEQDVAGSLKSLEEAQSLIEPIAIANPKSGQTLSQLARILQYKGDRQRALGEIAAAQASYRKAMALVEPFVATPPAFGTMQYVSNQQNLALLESSLGHHADALTLAEEARSRIEKLEATRPDSDVKKTVLAKAWCVTASTQATAGLFSAAQESAEHARKLWGTVKQPGMLTQYAQEIAEMQRIIDRRSQ